MKILAKTIKGKEYCYDAHTARKVSAASADKIRDIVNQYGFLIYSDAETWAVYDVDVYSTAYFYAERQAFTIRNGIVTARAY